jgi:hypothetical protein
MDFYAILDQVVTLLRQRERASRWLSLTRIASQSDLSCKWGEVEDQPATVLQFAAICSAPRSDRAKIV